MNQTNFNWKNKRVLITGGTSGLGKALTNQLLQLGASVVVIARNPKLSFENKNYQFIQGDISDKKQIHRIYAEALSHLQEIDILINNASSLGPTPLRLLLDTECEDFETVIQTNLLGPFRLMKLVLPQMLLRRKGLVINISSDAAKNPYPKWGMYSVSKAGLDHLTQIFSEELKDTGVNLMALDPGDMNTPMHFAAIPDANPSQLFLPEDSAKLMLQQIQEQKLLPVRRSLR